MMGRGGIWMLWLIHSFCTPFCVSFYSGANNLDDDGHNIVSLFALHHMHRGRPPLDIILLCRIRFIDADSRPPTSMLWNDSVQATSQMKRSLL
mmetsp:Transcript_9321/g.34495  ORF Transcript_9321/g.34495 Transcript_9321/m.34495 type:complete len:93 (-) Transcript_9321:132-410(-)